MTIEKELGGFMGLGKKKSTIHLILPRKAYYVGERAKVELQIFNSECTQVQDELDEMAEGLLIIATGLLEVLPKLSLDFLNYLFSDSVEVKY